MTDFDPHACARAWRNRLSHAAAGLLLCGCASYPTPGGPAPFADAAGATVAGGALTRPSLNIPARIAIARVQAADYKSFSTRAATGGRFGFIAGNESPSAAQIRSVDQWPSVAHVDALGPALVPEKLDSLEDLRLAAAKLQADVLLAYTLDTRFLVKGERTKPGTKLSLGDAADGAGIASTAAGLLIDVRTGYVYGSAQGSVSVDPLADAWRSNEALDQQRVSAEQQAFAAMALNAGKVWAGIAGPGPQGDAAP